MKSNFKRTHVGKFIKEECFKPLGLTNTEAAKKLKVSSQYLGAVLLGKKPLSARLAIALGKMLNTTPESWLIQQMQYDLWKEREKQKGKK